MIIGRMMAVSMAAMMMVFVIVLALVSGCESVLYQVRQSSSTLVEVAKQPSDDNQ